MDIEICDKMETITVGVSVSDTKAMESSGVTVLEDGKPTIKCLKCDYTSDKVTNCRRHYETMHTLLRVPEQCCGISFQTKGDYRDHRKVAHPGGLYFCHLCPAEPVKRKALLVRHMSIHTGIKQHTCKLCGYASPNKFNVKRHMVTHSVTSTNKNKEPKTEKTSENLNINNSSLNIGVPLSSSLLASHCVVLPDSTTDSLSNIKPTPILRGILNCQEDSFYENSGNVEEKRKKSIGHSINDILSRHYRPGQRSGGSSSAISSYQGAFEPRFPGNKEEDVREINSKMTCENWSGIDESCTKGYCYNWSHVSAPGSSYTSSLQPYPFEMPLYYNNYEYNYPPPRIHTQYNNNPPFAFFPDYPFSEIDSSARYLQPETKFLSPYESKGFPVVNTAPESHVSKQCYNYKQKVVESEEKFKVCHQDNPQAVLINQQESRFVPGLGVWSFKDSSADSLLPAFHYSGDPKESSLTDEGMQSQPPVAQAMHAVDRAKSNVYSENNIHSIYAGHGTNNVQKEFAPLPSESIENNPGKYASNATENALLNYVPKKLRLSKKFLTNYN